MYAQSRCPPKADGLPTVACLKVESQVIKVTTVPAAGHFPAG